MLACLLVSSWSSRCIQFITRSLYLGEKLLINQHFWKKFLLLWFVACQCRVALVAWFWQRCLECSQIGLLKEETKEAKEDQPWRSVVLSSDNVSHWCKWDDLINGLKQSKLFLQHRKVFPHLWWSELHWLHLQHQEWEGLMVVGVTQLSCSLCESKNYCTNHHLERAY